MLLRYRPEDVAVVIDSEHAGKTAQDVIGYSGEIPVVYSFSDAAPFNPDTLVLGGAPQGGHITAMARCRIFSS